MQDRRGFFVEPDECVVCGYCQLLAPGIFARSGRGEGVYNSSWVTRQPADGGELTDTIKAVDGCCVGAIYYGGEDEDIISRILKTRYPEVVLARPSP